jgi:hypothetical protein
MSPTVAGIVAELSEARVWSSVTITTTFGRFC